MRLYLSSFRLGNRPTELVKLSTGNRAALIMNALDHAEPAREKWRTEQRQALTELGFAVEDLDLRNFFVASADIARVLCNVDVVWVNGGNCLILQRAMRQSGFDLTIKSLLKQDRLVYAGFSAAADLARPRHCR